MLLDILYIVIFVLVTALAFSIAAARTLMVERDTWKTHCALVEKQRDSALAMLRRDSALLYRWTRPKTKLKIH